MKRKLFFLFFIQIHALVAFTQDSLQVLTIKDFFAIIMQNHPIVKQAQLLDEKAKQELRIARGLLDPSLNSKFYSKEYQAKDYYNLWDSYLRVPTWYGIDFKAGYERNTGYFVNQENTTPLNGLSYAGISVPLGQGLLIDERRAQIRQAGQFSTIATAEKIKIINKLLLQAAKDYWDWMYYYQKLNLYTEGFELATTRFNAVKERAITGDLPAIDTIETQMQVQNFQILLTQARVEYANASLILSNYLWNESEIPLEISEKVIPSTLGSDIKPLPGDSLLTIIELAQNNHPELVKLNAKLVQLDIERRLAADKFKPKLYLDYNIIQSSFFNQDILSDRYINNNYKVGASFNFPIPLRSERGKYQLTKLKILETDLELQQTNREIENNIKQSANDWIALARQIEIQENLVNNAEALRSGELIRFENGESSIFLVNARENSLISNRVKLFELKAKYAKSKAMLHWAAGILPLEN